MAARHPGWRIAIVPSAGVPLGVPFARDSAEPSAAATRAVATTAWALARWNAAAVEVIGRAASDERRPRALARARADAVAALLAERGISATASVDPVGPPSAALNAKPGWRRSAPWKSASPTLLLARPPCRAARRWYPGPARIPAQKQSV